jgi:predicted ATPase
VRRSDVDRIWAQLSSTVPKTRISAIKVAALAGVQDGSVTLSKRVHAIVGYNGSGKSTVLNCVRAVLKRSTGSAKALLATSRIWAAEIEVTVDVDNVQKVYTKAAGTANVQAPADAADVEYIDTAVQVPALQNFCRDTTNLHEQLEQHEPLVFSPADLQALSYLVGKDYDAASAVDLAEDFFTDEETQNSTTKDSTSVSQVAAGIVDYIPVFRAESGGITYTSADMGMGELALFYIYWRLRAAPPKAILLIEEPESFVAPQAQAHLANVVASFALKKGFSTVLATHSEHVLERIPHECVIVLARDQHGRHEMRCVANANDVFMHLRLSGRQVGTMFVEDWAGYYFLTEMLTIYSAHVLRRYKILPVFGDANVLQLAQLYPRSTESYPIVGVLDGDVRLTAKQRNWPCLKLPGTKAPEAEVRDAAILMPNVLATRLNRPLPEVKDALGLLGGTDVHDFVGALGGALGLTYGACFHHLIHVWLSVESNHLLAQQFATLLRECLADAEGGA